MPAKKSAAPTVRAPPLLAISSSASRARATAGYSAAGSAWASEPPTVPRLRIWKWPMRGVAAARSGAAAAMSSRSSTSHCRTMAPSVSAVADASTMRSDATRPTSTSASKRARRRLSIGTRLCPPARTLASSPSSLSSAVTSSTVVGAW